MEMSRPKKKTSTTMTTERKSTVDQTREEGEEFLGPMGSICQSNAVVRKAEVEAVTLLLLLLLLQIIEMPEEGEGEGEEHLVVEKPMALFRSKRKMGMTLQRYKRGEKMITKPRLVIIIEKTELRRRHLAG